MAGLLASIRVLFAKNWRIKQRESRLNKSRPTTPGAWLFPPMITDVVLPLVFILYLIQLFCSINQQVGDVNASGFATRELQIQAQEAMKWSLPSLSTSSSAVQAMTALPLLLTVTNMSLVTLDRPENRAFLAYLDRVYAGDASLGLVPPSAKTIVVPVPPNVDTNAVDAYLEAYPRTSGVAIYAAFDVRRVTSLAPSHARVFLYENDNHDPLRPKMPNDQVENYFTVNVQDGDDDGRVLLFPGVLPLQMELNVFLREPHAAPSQSQTTNKKNETISPVRACRLVDSMLYLSGLSWQDLPETSQLGGGEASCERAIKAGRVGAQTLAFLTRFDKQEASMDAMKSLNVHSLPKRPKKTISGPVESSIVFYMAYLFLWPFSRLVRDIVVEKEKQLKEYLLIMGLQPMALLVSWFLMYLVASIAVVAIAVVMLSDSMFVGTQASQVYFFMLLLAFALSMLLFGLAITPMFSSARTAAAAAPLMYLVLSAAPFLTSWIGEDAVEHSALRFVVWFMDQASSPVVFMDAIHGVLALDGVTAKIRPIAWETVAGPTWKMVAQSVGYLLLGWYLENVFPRAFGVQQPWYFVVQPSYWAPTRFGSASASRAGATHDEEELVGLTAEQEDANSASFAEDDTMREMAMADYLRHFRPILLVKALTKRYPNGKLAVNNVSFGVKKGEIFGLLGPNGAGKSTTMSILCGMLAPTNGDAFVGASSVVTDPLTIRKSLSVCFQQNILFDDLTVWEHLTLVYELKTALGIKAIDEEMWIHKLVHFGLDDKRDALSKTLSGGQKRKLSLVLALMDTSRVVLLDEPTAGMDLKARVDTWDALKKAVSHRAVILTTHSMQEAQALCENIGIVADGKLKCCGSSLFLREQFGVGYKLTIVHHDDGDTTNTTNKNDTANRKSGSRPSDSTKGDVMMAAVKKHVPQAELLSHNKWETRIQLNSDEPAMLIPVFDELEKMKRVDSIKRYAVAATDLEDVFVRVTDGGDVYYHVKDGANTQTPEETKMESSQQSKKPRAAPLNTASLESHDSRRTDVEAMPLQVRALLTKRWKLMVRDKRAFLAHYIWPLVLFVVLIAIGARQPGGGDYLETITSLPTSAASSSLFVGSLPSASAATQRMLAQVDPAARARIKWQQVETPAQMVDLISHNDTNTAFFGAVLVRNVTWARQDDEEFDDDAEKLLQFSIYYNDTIPRSLPATLQWMATAYCKTLRIRGDTDPRDACELAVTKSAFPHRSLFSLTASANGKAAEVEINPQGKAGDNLAQRFIVAIYILITLNSITSNYITTVAKERENGLKRLQYLHLASERASTVYWLAHLVFDYIGYTVALAVVFVIVVAYGMAWPSELMVALVVQSLAFGLSTLAFSYLFSLAFASHSSAQSVMSYVATFQLLGCSMLFALGTVPSLCSKVATVALFLRILPLVAYGEAVLNFATLELSLLRNQCLAMSAAATTSSTASSSFLASMTTSLANAGDLAAPSPWDWTVGGRPLAYLLSSFVLYMALLFVVDAMQSYPTILQNRLDWLLGRQPARVSRLPRDIESPSREILEVEHLTKVFNPKKKKKTTTVTTTSQSSDHQPATTGNANGVDDGEEDGGRPVLNASGQVVAVDDVSFTVERNDCVALLGVNGSGKSTTFEVLTSGIAPTSGSAYLGGIDVTLQPQLASRQYGYCPQTNIQFAELSVREHLQLFYRLRTREYHTIRQEEAVLQNLMAKLDLHQVENTTAGHLSGGNKRRLMLALSLLSADVEMLLMDEPSAGVDVVARRLMWKVLYERRQGNRELSCLFTTHSMEEAEAVCANAVVLNKGKLVWNGSIPELKHHAARGISITLRLDTASLWEQERVRYYVDRIRTALSAYTQDTIASDELETAWRVCREHNPRTKLLAGATPSDQQWITALVARVHHEHGVTNSATSPTSMTTATTGELNQISTAASMDTTDFVKEWLLREAFATIEAQLFADLITARSQEQVTSVDRQNAMGSGTSSTAVYETNCNGDFGLLDVFQTMEQHKAACAIARYSISELSLERVFEQFT